MYNLTHLRKKIDTRLDISCQPSADPGGAQPRGRKAQSGLSRPLRAVSPTLGSAHCAVFSPHSRILLFSLLHDMDSPYRQHLHRPHGQWEAHVGAETLKI